MNYDIKIKNGEATLVLPRAKLIELLSECSESELKALIALCAESDGEKARELCGLDSGEFDAALSFWRGAKLVTRQSKKAAAKETQAPAATASTEKEAVVSASAELCDIDREIPDYTSDEIKRITGNDRLLHSILDESQQVFGKVFNTLEMNYVIAMRDHLALDGEYILMLLQYFSKEGRPLIYVLKVAQSLVKEGVTDAEALDAYLKRRDAFKGIEGKYRDLFGIGTRKLTSIEEKYFHSWSHDMKMPFDLVIMAYERTVEKKGSPQKAYMNGILSSWHNASLFTEEDVLRHEQAQKESPNVKGSAKNGAVGEQSFDVNEFFDAALKRSYGKKE